MRLPLTSFVAVASRQPLPSAVVGDEVAAAFYRLARSTLLVGALSSVPLGSLYPDIFRIGVYYFPDLYEVNVGFE